MKKHFDKYVVEGLCVWAGFMVVVVLIGIAFGMSRPPDRSGRYLWRPSPVQRWME